MKFKQFLDFFSPHDRKKSQRKKIIFKRLLMLTNDVTGFVWEEGLLKIHWYERALSYDSSSE